MNKELGNLISTMYEVDQKARFEGNMFVVYSVDGVNEFRIINLIKTYGYPNKKTCDPETLKKFWLLIQHMDFNLDLQENCLAKCQFEPEQYAFLYDRIQVNKFQKQKFGTQLNKTIDSLEETNKARLKLGWNTIEEWVSDFNSREDRQLEIIKNNDGSATFKKIEAPN